MERDSCDNLTKYFLQLEPNRTIAPGLLQGWMEGDGGTRLQVLNT